MRRAAILGLLYVVGQIISQFKRSGNADQRTEETADAILKAVVVRETSNLLDDALHKLLQFIADNSHQF